MKKRSVLLLLFLCAVSGIRAQEWSSPEVEQMYRQAKEYLSKGAVPQAIQLLRQSIQLEPAKPVLYKDLAHALNISGKHKEALEAINYVMQQGRADEQSYQIAAIALKGTGNARKAKSTLEEGLGQFSRSGQLWYELGNLHESQNDSKEALAAWLSGIENEPGYHLNYYKAATAYAQAGKPVWTLLYGEQFVNLERFTNRSTEVRKLMMESYDKLFKQLAALSQEELRRLANPASFEDAVLLTFQRLSPVVSDGITTENLIMLRTRFMISWLDNYDEKYPYSLFGLHDLMLQNGHFDAYNQWLFGQVEHEAQFESWKKFHPSALPAFEAWAAANKLQPRGTDFYNSKDLKTLFPSGKRR